MLRKSLIGGLTLLSLCWLPSGCATRHNRLDAVTVIAEPEANQGTATAFDLVFVYDAASVALLPRSGPEWFRQKPELQAGLGTKLEVVSLQLPPASTVEVALPSQHGRAVAIFGYGSYFPAASQTPLQLQGFRHARVSLMAEGIAVIGQ